MNKTKFKKLKKYASRNRKRFIHGERFYKKALEERNIRFRRQIVINNFIVDFAFPEKNLIVEIDGDYHKIPEISDYDEYREKRLKEYGFLVLRFTDAEVMNETEDCVNCLDDFDSSENLERLFYARLGLINKIEKKGARHKKNPIRATKRKKLNFSCEKYRVIRPKTKLRY